MTYRIGQYPIFFAKLVVFTHIQHELSCTAVITRVPS